MKIIENVRELLKKFETPNFGKRQATVKEAASLTTDRSDPGLNDNTQGQNTKYLVLPDEKREEFVRPVRQSYVHKKCGVVTRMGLALAETYATNPKFYSATFCVGCHTHLPVSEFLWDGTKEEVGS